MTVLECGSDTVERWRVRVLEAAGYPPEDALLLAVDPGVDLHEAVELLEQGCPPAVALMILL